MNSGSSRHHRILLAVIEYAEGSPRKVRYFRNWGSFFDAYGVSVELIDKDSADLLFDSVTPSDYVKIRHALLSHPALCFVSTHAGEYLFPADPGPDPFYIARLALAETEHIIVTSREQAVSLTLDGALPSAMRSGLLSVFLSPEVFSDPQIPTGSTFKNAVLRLREPEEKGSPEALYCYDQLRRAIRGMGEIGRRSTLIDIRIGEYVPNENYATAIPLRSRVTELFAQIYMAGSFCSFDLEIGTTQLLNCTLSGHVYPMGWDLRFGAVSPSSNLLSVFEPASASLP